MSMFPSYRNQSNDLDGKSTDWFLNGGNIDMKKVNWETLWSSQSINTLPFPSFSFNPLGTNPTKWSNTLQSISWVCLTILWGWCLRVNSSLLMQWNSYLIFLNLFAFFAFHFFLPFSFLFCCCLPIIKIVILENYYFVQVVRPAFTCWGDRWQTFITSLPANFHKMRLQKIQKIKLYFFNVLFGSGKCSRICLNSIKTLIFFPYCYNFVYALTMASKNIRKYRKC